MALERYSREAVAQRLREARVAKFNSAADASRAMGMKDVTVRAHENGQNGLTNSTAQRYARAYGVSPEWLLYGEERGGFGQWAKRERLESVRRSFDELSTPVFQNAHAGIYSPEPDYRKREDAKSFLHVSVNGYEYLTSIAFMVADHHASAFYSPGTFLICGGISDADLRWGDHVVVALRHPSDPTLVETTVRGIDVVDGAIVCQTLDGDPRPVEIDERLKDDDVPGKFLGVVLGEYRKRDRDRPAIRSAEELQAYIKATGSAIIPR